MINETECIRLFHSVATSKYLPTTRLNEYVSTPHLRYINAQLETLHSRSCNRQYGNMTSSRVQPASGPRVVKYMSEIVGTGSQTRDGSRVSPTHQMSYSHRLRPR